MTSSHPVTPPPELVQQWLADSPEDGELGIADYITTQAARWGYQQGADAELNECCKWLPKLPPWSADDLRKHRRPKPPSLKEQALKALDDISIASFEQDAANTIRHALEQLDD